jgi:hypothetical protein
MGLTIAILGLIATTVAALAAVGSWRAAQKSTDVARIVAGIEAHRHQAELTPRFQIRWDVSGDAETVDLWLKLIGPTGIDRLDKVTAVMVDDRTLGYFPGPGPEPPPTLTPQQIDQHVWGPYKFKEGIDGADANGRTATQTGIVYGIEYSFRLVANPAPPWWKGDKKAESEWVFNYMGYVNLNLNCTLDGFEPWAIPIATYAWTKEK